MEDDQHPFREHPLQSRLGRMEIRRSGDPV